MRTLFFDRSLVESGLRNSFVVVVRNILSVIYPTLGVFRHVSVLDMFVELYQIVSYYLNKSGMFVESYQIVS